MCNIRELYPAKTITDKNYSDELLLVNTPVQAESQLHNLEQAAGGIGLHINTNKMKYLHFKRERAITSGSPLKFVDKLMYLGGSISSTESDVNIHLVKAWVAINRLLIMWKSD